MTEPMISELTVVAAFGGVFAAVLLLSFLHLLVTVLRKPKPMARPVPDTRSSIELFRRMNTP